MVRHETGHGFCTVIIQGDHEFQTLKSAALKKNDNIISSKRMINHKNKIALDGPDVIRTHDLPVISRAHHRAMLRAQKIALFYPNNYSTRVFIGCESPGQT